MVVDAGAQQTRDAQLGIAQAVVVFLAEDSEAQDGH